MRRREFITLAGGAVISPRVAHAQQVRDMRTVGVIMTSTENDAESQTRIAWVQLRLAAFEEGLRNLGWTEGHNIHIETRFATGDDQYQPLAKQLVAKQPKVIFAPSTPVTAALQRETRTIPIVFVSVSDPIGSGFVASLARPGSNITGLQSYEASITGKWLAILREIAPRLTRAALVANPKTTAYDHFLRGAEAAATSLGIELLPYPVKNAADIESTIESVARVPDVGLVLPPDITTNLHRDLIITLAARYGLPAVYAYREFVLAGGLVAYSNDTIEQYRQAASYVDQILRGANPAELPVQTPTKFKTFVNVKTAKALGLDVPPLMLVRADEVIE